MKHFKTLRILIILIAIFSPVATLVGILAKEGTGIYEYVSIRGQSIEIYGRGPYKHMSTDVAIQGIAQDYVTLIVGIPLLLISFFWSGRSSFRGRFILAGSLMYFFVTYLFYLCMGMYNYLFLVYIFLTSTSFFALAITVISLNIKTLETFFSPKLPSRLAGGFLMFNAAAIGLMWLSLIVPPLIQGEVYPEELNHYTTLIVQGLDLSLLLPLGFVAGWFFIKKKRIGLIMAPVYMIFLAILMTALTAKVIGMSVSGVDAGPAFVIIPFFNVIAIAFSLIILKNMKEDDFLPYFLTKF